MKYEEFVKAKAIKNRSSGFEIAEHDLNKKLFPFQRYIVARALRAGRYAVFADCGLGKTFMQLEWAYRVTKQCKKNVLILAPLAVVGQTIEEGDKFGIDAFRYNGKEDQSDPSIYVTNYEQLKKIPHSFINSLAGIVLDESSILKNFQGKFRNLIIGTFSKTPYKLACTATPSPNDHMELGNHVEFLGIMKLFEMLSMFFVHDAGNTGNWRLKKHAKKEFWKFVSTWAVMLSSPSDIGFSSERFDLPELRYIEKLVPVPNQDNGMLFNDAAVSATTFNRQLKITLLPRMEAAAELVNRTKEPFIVWVNRNDEADKIKKLIPDAEEVRGNEKPEIKEKKLLGFGREEFRVLVTKKKIAQFGLNYQHCNNQVFASLDFSFEGLYQAVRRSYRFGQRKPVNIYMITTETMGNVIEAIAKKQAQFEEMQAQMARYCHVSQQNQFERTNYMERIIEKPDYTIRQGDCVQRIKELPDNAVHLSIFSPPFADLYVYNDLPEDIGNVKNYDEFADHFAYLIPELARVMMPGRIVAVHCMDLPIQKGKEGFIGLRDFSGLLVKAFADQGFIYHSRTTIWKNPVTEMQRTKALGLLHKQIKKDSVMSRTGIPDYILAFRAPGENPVPITHQDTDQDKSNYLPVDLWQKYASPVWLDINQSDTLNEREARAEKDEKHLCPLQLPTIERCIHLWSNEGETIMDPFGGIMSTGYQALKMNRKFIGFELKTSYFNTGAKNLERAKLKKSQITLF